MANLYKRIVTLGMVSFTAILAWVYCILIYRTEAVYVIGASLVVVASLYALLLALVDLKLKKEAQTKAFAEEKLAELLAKQNQSDDLLTIERLLKASYVQQRKTNTRLAKMAEDYERLTQSCLESDQAVTEILQAQISSSINKAIKILVKYNRDNNQKLLDELDDLKREIQSIELSPVVQVNGVAAPAETIVETVTETVSEPDEEAAFDSDAFLASFEEPVAEKKEDTVEAVEEPTVEEVAVEEPVAEEAPVAEEPVVADDPNKMLSPDDIAALFAAAEKKEDTVEAVEEPSVEEVAVEEPVAEEAPVAEEPAVADDPNKMLSPDDIAALFAAAEKKEDVAEPAPDENLADVIPFPSREPEDSAEAAEAATEEPTVEDAAPVDDNPNRQLSPEEIAALFASAEKNEDTAEEPVAVEETPAPVDDNPNRQLSPDEIAALFASAEKKEEAIEEPEPVAEAPAPLDDNPNRQLSPEEIAALFASANG